MLAPNRSKEREEQRDMKKKCEWMKQETVRYTEREGEMGSKKHCMGITVRVTNRQRNH